MTVDSWFALFAPKGTPAGTVSKIGNAVKSALEANEVRKKMEEQGAEPVASSPAELAKILSADLAT
ncbi:MAG: hypothetical protein JNL68_07590 [Burkholderiales bacterium]|nr:hypothetical protein [Burkholderiales bacterium]